MSKSKVCSKCNTEALSNNAKTCYRCGEPFTKKAAVRNEKKKRGRPRKTESKPVIPATSRIHNDFIIEEKAKKVKSLIAAKFQIPSEIANAYTVTVDFARYPKLHDRLLKMSEDEIRTPGVQLMFLLRNTLQSMEDAV